MRKHFGWDKSDSVSYLVNSIVEESLELKDAFNQEDLQEMAYELADVLMTSITLAKMLDLNVESIIADKIEIVMARNYD